MATIKLCSNTDINQVVDLKEQLIVALQSSEPIIFDASFADNVSTPLLQLLLITKMECDQKDNNVFTIKDPSQSFLTAIKDFGCFAHFEGSFQWQN